MGCQGNISIVSNNTFVSSNISLPHLTATVQLVIFRPKRGDILVGTVNKVGEEFIGLLIYGRFQTFIPEYSVEKETKTNFASFFYGSRVRFIVKDIYFRDRIFLVGSLKIPLSKLLHYPGLKLSRNVHFVTHTMF